MTVDITIPGKPTSKGRPRFSRRSGRTYTPAATAEAEDTIKQRAMALLASTPGLPLEGPLRLEATFTLTPPSSWSKKKAAANWSPSSKPDLDNLLKLASDALNGIAWVDDAQLVTIITRKVFGPAPSTRLVITQESP